VSAATPLGLYVHFPWCVSKCPYCDFNSHALRGGEHGREAVPESQYIEALQRDLGQQLESQAALLGDRAIDTVFMGGGTPSLFSPAAIGRLLEGIRGGIGLAATAEVTLEANPGTIERGRFREYAAVGVNRVSLGAQSFDAALLQRLGRIHSPAETFAAVDELRAAGLDNFNLDLMYGLPGQDIDRAVQDVTTAIALGPRQVSHYHLTLEPGTGFAARPPGDLPGDEQTERMLALSADRFAAAGYRQYEVSAWARDGGRCAHNLVYWSFGDYLGIGAGAHGKLGGPDPRDGGFVVRRCARQREPRRYQRSPQAAGDWHDVPPAQLPFEFMLNALRLTEGFESALFEQRTGLPWGTVAATVARLCARGLLQVSAAGSEVTDGTPPALRIAATALGWRFLNDVLVEFLPAESAA
jgi:oxygen-independent coproporphyrinogen-3 oxidase